MSINKHAIKTGIFSFGVLLAIGIAAVLVLRHWLINNRWEESIKKQVVERVNSAICGFLTIDSLRVDGLSKYSFFGVSIKSSPSSEPEITAKQVIMNLNLIGLIKRKIEIRNAVVKNGYVRYWLTKPDIIASLFRARDSAKKTENSGNDRWKFLIDRIMGENLEIAAVDSTGKPSGLINLADCEGTIREGGLFYLKIGSSAGFFYWNNLRFQMDKIAVELTISGDSLSADNIDVRFLHGIELQGRTTVGFGKAIPVNGSIFISADREGMAPFIKKSKGMIDLDRFECNADFRGTITRPIVTFNLRANGMSFKKIDLSTVLTNGYFKMDSLRTVGLAVVKSRFGKFTIEYGHDSLHTVRVDSREVVVDTLLDALHIPRMRLPTRMSLSLMASGKRPIDLPSIAELELGSIKNSNSSQVEAEVRVRASLKKGLWKLKSTVGRSNLFSGKGTLSQGYSINGNFSMDSENPEQVLSLFTKENIAGSLSGNGTITGTLFEPRISGMARSDNLHWEGMRLLASGVSVSWAKGELIVDTIFGKIQGNAAVTLKWITLDSGATARISASFQGSGTPGNFKASVRASASQVNLFGKGIDSIYANALYRDSSFTITDWYMRAESTVCMGTAQCRIWPDESYLHINCMLRSSRQVTGSGWGSGSFYLGNFKGDSLYLEGSFSDIDLSVLHGVIPVSSKMFTGTISGTMDVHGTKRNPSVGLKFSMGNIMVMEHGGDAAVSGYAYIKDSTLSVRCTVFVDREKVQSLCINGNLPLKPSLGWRVDTSSMLRPHINLSGKDVNLSNLTNAYTENSSINGIIDADIVFAYIADHWVPDGLLRIRGGSILYPEERMYLNDVNGIVQVDSKYKERGVVFRVSVDSVGFHEYATSMVIISGRCFPDRAVVDTVLANLGGGILFLDAKFPYVKASALLSDRRTTASFQIDDIPIASIFGNNIPVNEIYGRLKGKGSYSGGKTNSSIRGWIKVDSAGFAIKELWPPVGPIYAEAEMSGDTFKVSKLEGKWGSGVVNGSVVVHLASQKNWDALCLIKGKAISFSQDEKFKLTIDSTNLSLIAQREKVKIEGTVNIGQSIIDQTVFLGTPLRNSRNGKSRFPKGDINVAINLYNNLDFKLNVAQRTIRRPFLKSDVLLDGKLLLSGQTDEPRLSGNLQTTSGKIQFLDRDFVVEKGDFRQTDQYVTNPRIQLRAVAEIYNDDIGEIDTVRIFVDSTLDAPMVRLEASGRQYSEAEILSLVLFGKTKFATSANAGSWNALLQQRGVELLATQMSSFAARKVENIFKLENVNLEGSPAGGSYVSSFTLSATKRVSNKVRITYTGAITDKEKQKVRLSWKLLRYLFLEGEIATDGSESIDLKLKYSK